MAERIKVRVLVPILAMSLLLLGLGIGAAWYVVRMQQEASELVADSVSAIRVAEALVIDSREIRSRLHDFIDTDDPSHLEKVVSLNETLKESLDEAEQRAQDPGRTPRERELIKQVRSGFDQFADRFQAVFEEKESRPRASVRVLIEENINVELVPAAHEYLDFRQDQITEISEQNQRITYFVVAGLLLLGICGAVAGLVGGFGIHRAISRSLVRLSVPVRNAAGKLNEVVGPIELSAPQDAQDVEGLEAVMQRVSTQVAHVVDELHRSQRDALRAEQLAAVGQLAAGLAHELRNPLMAMKLLVQSAVERGEAGSLQGRNLRVLDEEIRRQEQAIQTFLDFARPPKMEPRRFDLRPMIEQTVALVTGRAARQQVRCEVQLPSEPLEMEGDPVQIRQVLLNLLFNALDVLPGGGKVRVDAVRVLPGESGTGLPGVGGTGLSAEGSAGVLEIRITDTGPGLPMELGERIFEPFVSTKETGMGLGLSICRRIVEAHDGEIVARNREPESGAEFLIRLPAVVVAVGALA